MNSNQTQSDVTVVKWKVYFIKGVLCKLLFQLFNKMRRYVRQQPVEEKISNDDIDDSDESDDRDDSDISSFGTKSLCEVHFYFTELWTL